MIGRLRAFAVAAFKGAVYPDEHGKTERDYANEFIRRSEQTGGAVPSWCHEYAETPALDDDLAHWWSLFSRLHRMRPFGNGGPAPIDPASLVAFGQLHGIEFGPFEVEIIEAIDGEYLRAYADGRRSRTERQG